MLDDGTFKSFHELLQVGQYAFPRRDLIKHYEEIVEINLKVAAGAAGAGDVGRCSFNMYSAVTKRLQIAELSANPQATFDLDEACSLARPPDRLSAEEVNALGLPIGFEQFYNTVHKMFRGTPQTSKQIEAPAKLIPLAETAARLCGFRTP